MSQADIQRWSREVAEDPGAPSFVRLARTYRKRGRTAAAREVVERGLSRHPEHLAAHCLLALLRLDEGDRDGARDEWEIVLRVEPESFDALRGLGFLALERDDLGAARRYLDSAARIRPSDPAVSEARQLVALRVAGAERSLDASAASGSMGGDPALLFQRLRGEPTFQGALLLDRRGRPVAGALGGAGDGGGHVDAEMLGGLMAGVAEEARRTAELLGIGSWDRVLLDAEEGMVDISSMAEDSAVVLLAKAGTPVGWTVRLAGRARDLARRFLEAAS
jgi:predicted regulator of Ras-like GTPase activity (Roadblock/LC7/MglB family)